MSEFCKRTPTPVQGTPQAHVAPAAFLIGAQKCATTFLAEALDRHPDVCVAQPKEPDYFSANHGKGPAWYRSCFPHPNAKVLLDASTSYSIAPSRAAEQTATTPTFGVAARIAAVSPKARIIYVVRDPVERTYSAYWHEVRTGYEDRAFLDAIQARAWYLDASRYHFQISQYIEQFGDSNVLILTKNDVTGDPANAFERVWRFLGLEPAGLESDVTVARNAGYTYSALGNLLFRNPRIRNYTRPLARFGRGALPQWLQDRLRARLLRAIPPMRADERRTVVSYLADDMVAFAQLTGLDGWVRQYLRDTSPDQ